MTFHLVVVFYEGKLSRLQELSLGDVQAVFTVEELDNGAIAVPHCEIVLHHQTLQMFDHTPVDETQSADTHTHTHTPRPGLSLFPSPLQVS